LCLGPALATQAAACAPLDNPDQRFRSGGVVNGYHRGQCPAKVISDALQRGVLVDEPNGGQLAQES
jgi:hypothetical protein